MASQWRATTAQKVAWLREHPELWKNLPQLDQRPFDTGMQSRLAQLRLLMTDAGLYSRKSYWVDVEASILKHVNMIRTILRKERYGGSEQD